MFLCITIPTPTPPAFAPTGASARDPPRKGEGKEELIGKGKDDGAALAELSVVMRGLDPRIHAAVQRRTNFRIS